MNLGRKHAENNQRKGPSPVKPLKLAKQIIRERTFDKEAEEEPNEQEPNVTSEIKERSQQINTNPTVLSKQIKIVTQFNAKQIDNLIADRNTIKA